MKLETLPDFENGEILGTSLVPIRDGFILRWSVKTVGFGEITFLIEKGKKVHCMSEGMGKNFVKRILLHVLEQSELDE